MTTAEAINQINEFKTTANKALQDLQTAVAAFNVALARRDWRTAAFEHVTILRKQEEHLDAVACAAKLAHSLESQ